MKLILRGLLLLAIVAMAEPAGAYRESDGLYSMGGAGGESCGTWRADRRKGPEWS